MFVQRWSGKRTASKMQDQDCAFDEDHNHGYDVKRMRGYSRFDESSKGVSRDDVYFSGSIRGYVDCETVRSWRRIRQLHGKDGIAVKFGAISDCKVTCAYTLTDALDNSEGFEIGFAVCLANSDLHQRWARLGLTDVIVLHD